MPTLQVNCNRQGMPISKHDARSCDAETKRMLEQTVVIIPARNEEASIGRVLDDIPPVACVIVINNGSSDDTAEIARRAGALVIDVPIAGYGRACRVGLHAVRRLKRKGFAHHASFVAHVQSFGDIRYVAFLDGDYSDFPDQLPMLVAPIHRDEADFVLGSRLTGSRERGAMPPQAVFGNWLACTLIRWIWGHRFSDLGPFRVIRLDRLNQLDLKDKNFGWTVEMQIKAVRSRLRILEIPVHYRCRIGASKISGTLTGTVRAGYKILTTIAKYALLPN